MSIKFRGSAADLRRLLLHDNRSTGFGSTSGVCFFNSPGYVYTNWDPGTDMLLRKSFTLPTTATTNNVLAIRAHDGGVASYIDQNVTYDVPVYSLCVLYDQTKSAKAGATVPLKFQLCDQSGANVSSAAITVTATSLTKKDNTASSTVEDSGNANPDSNFRYDASLGGYIFNKSTKGLTSGTYTVSFTVGGDSEAGYKLSFDVK
jgi:hypothetical protein